MQSKNSKSEIATEIWTFFARRQMQFSNRYYDRVCFCDTKKRQTELWIHSNRNKSIWEAKSIKLVIIFEIHSLFLACVWNCHGVLFVFLIDLQAFYNQLLPIRTFNLERNLQYFPNYQSSQRKTFVSQNVEIWVEFIGNISLPFSPKPPGKAVQSRRIGFRKSQALVRPPAQTWSVAWSWRRRRRVPTWRWPLLGRNPESMEVFDVNVGSVLRGGHSHGTPSLHFVQGCHSYRTQWVRFQWNQLMFVRKVFL